MPPDPPTVKYVKPPLSHNSVGSTNNGGMILQEWISSNQDNISSSRSYWPKVWPPWGDPVFGQWFEWSTKWSFKSTRWTEGYYKCTYCIKKGLHLKCWPIQFSMQSSLASKLFFMLYTAVPALHSYLYKELHHFNRQWRKPIASSLIYGGPCSKTSKKIYKKCLHMIYRLCDYFKSLLMKCIFDPGQTLMESLIIFGEYFYHLKSSPSLSSHPLGPDRAV